jgi:hypothetical protein
MEHHLHRTIRGRIPRPVVERSWEMAPAAVTYLDGFAADLGLSSEEDWEVLGTWGGSDTLQHARLRETHLGVPVLGSEIAVHGDRPRSCCTRAPSRATSRASRSRRR